MNERLQPAFLGGLFIGVLSALPLVNAGNCCCCLWVISGGVLATYLRQQQTPLRIDAAEGALVGMLAGVVGAVIFTIVSIPVEAVFGPIQRQWLERILASNPEVSADYRDTLDRFATVSGSRLVGMLSSLVIYVIFATIGGLLGVAIFKKRTPPPPGTVEILPPV